MAFCVSVSLNTLSLLRENSHVKNRRHLWNNLWNNSLIVIRNTLFVKIYKNNILTWRNIYGFSSIRFNHSGSICGKHFVKILQAWKIGFSIFLSQCQLFIIFAPLPALLFYLFYFSERMKRIRAIVAHPIIGLTIIAISFQYTFFSGRLQRQILWIKPDNF